MKRSPWRSLAVFALLLPACAAGPDVAPYGEPVRFSKNRELVFRDFSLRYLGERHVSHPVFKPGFNFQDFEVTNGRERQTISWSSGTGVIDATSFKVSGAAFALELRGSVARKGWLREDEMVVWPERDFRAALEKRNRESRR